MYLALCLKHSEKTFSCTYLLQLMLFFTLHNSGMRQQ